MRVLLITGHDHWGGLDANSPIARIVIGLGDAGHDVIYISNDKVSDPVTEIYGQPINFFHERVKIVRFRIPGDSTFWPLARRVPVIRSIYQRLREAMFILVAIIVSLREARTPSPDIVYGYEIYGVIAGRIVASFVHRPFVSRFQGTIMYPLLLQARKRFRSRLNLVRYYVHLLALKCPANLVVMTNDGTRGEWVVRALGNRSPLVFWFNGTDFLETVQGKTEMGDGASPLAAQWAIPSDGRMIISVSRLVGWKRVDRILRAFPFVRSQVPGVWYVVVGDGPERTRLEQMARTLGVGDRVVFTGNLPHSQVKYAMQRASVFVSMYDLSNVGNPLIEALSLGKPVVTYDVGDTREVIQDGVNGLLLKSDAPEDVGQAIVRILTDPALAQALQREARDYARRHFWSWNQRIKAEIRLLERVARGEDISI